MGNPQFSADSLVLQLSSSNYEGTAGAAVPGKGVLIMGSDGALSRAIKTAADGSIAVAAADLNVRSVLAAFPAQVGVDQAAAFANNAAANTQVSITTFKPIGSRNKFRFSVYNPSTVTDLTVKVFGVDAALGGGSRNSLVGTYTIPKAATVTGTAVNSHINYVDMLDGSGDLVFVVSNVTALGAAEGFTAYLRVFANVSPIGLVASNIINNGGFVGVVNWSGNNTEMAAAGNVLTATGSGGGAVVYVYQVKAFVSGHKYYMRAKAGISDAVCLSLILGTNLQNAQSVATPVNGTVYTLSNVLTMGADNLVRVYGSYADAATQNAKVMTVKEVLCIDLTDLFGAGKEPTTAQCDMFINWFDGSDAV